VNMHTLSFDRAMKAAMREDADVMMLGELRDLRTVEMALGAASNGHLVFSTMHTINAPKAIERLIEFYPVQKQLSIRNILADCIRAIVAQQLIPRSDGWGRIPAMEVMINCLPVANLIREYKVHQIITVIQTNKNLGMICLDDYLIRLMEEGKITAKSAYEHAIDKKKLEAAIRPQRS
jgi:twitching motility protein PilT